MLSSEQVHYIREQTRHFVGNLHVRPDEFSLVNQTDDTEVSDVMREMLVAIGDMYGFTWPIKMAEKAHKIYWPEKSK